MGIIFLTVALGGYCFLEAGLFLYLLNKRKIVAIRHVASTHKNPTPMGGGVAVCDSMFLAIAYGVFFHGGMAGFINGWFLGCLIFLAIISWIDDLSPISPIFRLLAQFGAVAVMLPFLPETITPFSIPIWVTWIFGFFFWIGFTNFFNFMDGIDLITIVETVSICAGIALVTWYRGESFELLGIPALVLISVMLGFLYWNLPPARFFLGDVGTIPLGFALAGALLTFSGQGFWEATLILPLFYYMENIFVIAYRLWLGEKIWEPHSYCFYKKAFLTQRHSHGTIIMGIICCNMVLIFLAWLSEKLAWWITLPLALCTVLVLFYWLVLPKKKK